MPKYSTVSITNHDCVFTIVNHIFQLIPSSHCSCLTFMQLPAFLFTDIFEYELIQRL